MNYKINWATKLDYDTVLENIVLVVYFDKETNIYSTVGMSDRETTVNDGSPWYTGAFGNCLICLNSKRTDTLYLLDREAINNVNRIIGKIKYNKSTITDDERNEIFKIIRTQLEEYAVTTICREENINAKAG